MAQLRLDQIEERREHNLLARNAASQDDYDSAEAQKQKSAAQVESDQASLAQADADYEMATFGSRPKSPMPRPRSKMPRSTWAIAACSPRSIGRIGELKVKLGNLVGDTGETDLVTIQQLDPMGLDLHPAARYLPAATALLTAGPRGRCSRRGRTSASPSSARPSSSTTRSTRDTSTFLVRAEVPNPDGSILPGQYIKATVDRRQVRRRRRRPRASGPARAQKVIASSSSTQPTRFRSSR